MFNADFFHVGVRVPDVERAMAEFGQAMSLTWASLQDRLMRVWLPDLGHVELQLALTYSVEGPVHLELMSGPVGSIWDGNDVAGPHHFGYWVDDVTIETTRLLAQGWQVELAADSPENGYGRFSYLRSPAGILVEPVAVANRARFERWWAGGSLTDPAPAS